MVAPIREDLCGRNAGLEHFPIGLHQRRHCEAPRTGGEAIEKLAQAALDCFTSLAMTIQYRREML
jgi:hypothetical protein